VRFTRNKRRLNPFTILSKVISKDCDLYKLKRDIAAIVDTILTLSLKKKRFTNFVQLIIAKYKSLNKNVNRF
jgi:hypothetical protein